MISGAKKFLLPFGGSYRVDALTGITVALALIPEAIAFALVAHLNPLMGLYAAFFMCFITALIGARPGMISGATGSTAIVMVALVLQFGVNYVFAAVVLSGLIQIIIGCLRLGKLVRMLPKPVMVGFVNGLAIVIFVAQLNQFKVIEPGHAMHWLSTSSLLIMSGLVLLAMSVTQFLPRLTKAIPSALAAVIVVSVLVYLFNIHTRVVQDMMGSQQISSSLPVFSWIHIPFTWHAWAVVFSYGLVLAVTGLSESLMTLALIDDKTDTHGKANLCCFAQGLANMVSGFFQSMGGCAMIGQSMINITSGGRGRLSGLVAGLFLLLFVIVLWPFIKLIPLAALVGVMFIVVIETFEWSTFKFISKIPFADSFIIVVVTVVTATTNLALAGLVGIVLSSLVFAWQTAKNIHADRVVLADNSVLYVLHGPLFFGSITQFKLLFKQHDDPESVVIDFKNARIFDHSAIDAVKFVTLRYLSLKKSVSLRHLSIECRQLLGKSGGLVEVNVLEDPEYHVATDALD